MKEGTYIVASSKDWNKQYFNELARDCKGVWCYADSRECLDGLLKQSSPRYIFFLHWNWKVPRKVYEQHECVCFHMTDVPYGRGGSPLQNLIVRGYKETVVSALKMEEELDAGPVYLKKPLSLSGRAGDIYKEASKVCLEIIRWMVTENPSPVEQTGSVVMFKRRTQSQSELPNNIDLYAMYDHIRMLDAPGYPHAFISYGELRINFSDAQINNEELIAKVTITRRKREDEL